MENRLGYRKGRREEPQHDYSWRRSRGSLNREVPIDRYCELIENTFSDEVVPRYGPEKERIQKPNCQMQIALRMIEKLKRSP